VLEATALRVGELVKLQWGDVDLRSSRLRVSRARTKGRTSGQRFAQVPPPLMDELQELLPLEDRTAERRVFAGLSESSVKAAMWRACKQAEITAYHPHDLRRRRLSLWHGQGVPARVLAERAGHTHASMSLDIYSHVIDPGVDEWLA
jgi:integrase